MQDEDEDGPDEVEREHDCHEETVDAQRIHSAHTGAPSGHTSRVKRRFQCIIHVSIGIQYYYRHPPYKCRTLNAKLFNPIYTRR